MAVQLIPATVLFIGIFFLHESPLWLMRKNKQDQANRTLVELRNLPLEHPCKGNNILSKLFTN
jgi:hypothetical protein